MERISRRDFFKLSANSLGALMLKDLLKSSEPEVLVDLPLIRTNNTPLYVEQLTRGGDPIVPSLSVNNEYTPVWIQVSDMPFDILTPIRRDLSLTVPKEFKPLDSVAWVADLPHVTGLQPTVLKAVVAYGDLNAPRYLNGTLESKKTSDIISTYAFTDRTRIYPAKIYNILTALSLISDWMRLNGPITQGRIYSYLEMAGPAQRNKDEYITNGIMDAGGICASVTTTSKVNFIASQLGLMENTMRFLHDVKIQYAENPFDPAITKANSDATVGFVPGRPDTYKDNSDYKFKLTPDAPDMYLSYKAHLVMDEKPIDKSHPARHVKQPADARLIFTAILSRSRPDYEKSIKEFLALRDAYARFHNFEDGLRGSLTRP